MQEKQHRYFKARAIKFNRKLNRLGQKAVKPPFTKRVRI